MQEAVETAIKSLTGAAAPIQAAGRTDAGVHAKGQVVHVDLDRVPPEHVGLVHLPDLVRGDVPIDQLRDGRQRVDLQPGGTPGPVQRAHQ